jgi:hypothetical protein
MIEERPTVLKEYTIAGESDQKPTITVYPQENYGSARRKTFVIILE